MSARVLGFSHRGPCLGMLAVTNSATEAASARRQVERIERQLEAKDMIWIAALGSACRFPVRSEEIRATILTVCGALWKPVDSLVVNAIEEMIRAGHLRQSRPEDESRFTTTSQGKDVLRYLLCVPAQRPGVLLGQAGHRLKLAFIDLLPFSERRRQLQSAVAAHETELAVRRAQCADCQLRGAYGRLWFEHDCERLTCDIALLRSMAGFNADPDFGDIA